MAWALPGKETEPLRGFRHVACAISFDWWRIRLGEILARPRPRRCHLRKIKCFLIRNLLQLACSVFARRLGLETLLSPSVFVFEVLGHSVADVTIYEYLVSDSNLARTIDLEDNGQGT